MNEFDVKDPRSVFPDNVEMQRLGEAVLRGDMAALAAGLKADPAAATRAGVEGVGLLMLAVVNSQRDAVRVLMRAGADPHQPTSRLANLGRPAAMALRMRGQPDIFSAMIEEGLDLNGGKEGEGEMLVVLAVFEADDFRLRQMLATGKVNVNLANAAQVTPLLTATRSRQYAKALMLLDAGADPRLGRTNLLVELGRHKWAAGTPTEQARSQLVELLRARGVTESTVMQQAPVRPAGTRR